MPSFVNTQTQAIVDNISGGFPDGSYGAYAPVVAAAAAGSSQATATVITTPGGQILNVSGATGSNGITLPIALAGSEIMVYSNAATNALLVFPPLGGAVNNGTVNASASLTARKLHQLVALDNVGNYALQLSA